MPAQELSLFSYEILGLVGRGGAGAHDLLRMARDGRMLDWAGESQYYSEPKRLARLGYLSAHREPGKTRERTVYSVTDKGLEALRDYARTPVGFTPLKSEALVRLLICDLVGEGVTRESMAALRGDLADIARRLDDAERRARALPHRAKYLLLTVDFMRRFLRLHLELIDEVERELAPTTTRRARRSA
jgi:DNA-binding PadR family transcriptional regulator